MLYRIVCAEACYHYESFQPKNQSKDQIKKIEQTPYWKRLVASSAIAFVGIGSGALLLFNSSRDVVRLSYLPNKELLRVHTCLNLPLSFRSRKRLETLNKGTYVPLKNVSLKESSQSHQFRSLSALPLSVTPSMLPFGLDKRFPWRVNVVPPQKNKDGFYIDSHAWSQVFKSQWTDLLGKK